MLSSLLKQLVSLDGFINFDCKLLGTLKLTAKVGSEIKDCQILCSVTVLDEKFDSIGKE